MMRIDYEGRNIVFRGNGDWWWCWVTMWWLIGYEEEWKNGEPT